MLKLGRPGEKKWAAGIKKVVANLGGSGLPYNYKNCPKKTISNRMRFAKFYFGNWDFDARFWVRDNRELWVATMENCEKLQQFVEIFDQSNF